MEPKTKTVVIGAGPVGALAAIYAAQRGHDVEVYELRNDLRDPSTTPLNFTKSINLALSERGIHAMRDANREGLIESIMAETIPMRGRMIHGRKTTDGGLYEQSQDYDVHGRAIYAVDRGGLNKRLLDELESMPNVKIFFNRKLTGADFKKNLAWFELRDTLPPTRDRAQEIEVKFDFLIGADGAHSAARYHLMKFARLDYFQEYIDTLWCEFQISPIDNHDKSVPESQFRISPHHLHIWPGKEFMFIAIPSLDGSFTCTLFLPARHFEQLSCDPTSLPAFFDDKFPGVTSLIPPKALIESFQTNPHLPLISIKCRPYHYSHSVVIVGDAAHAMVPFYGQGMNAGLEDVRILFSTLDRYTTTSTSDEDITAFVNPSLIQHQRAEALEEYSKTRAPDAAAINDLALQNYTEMRALVVSPRYRLRKFLEETLSVYAPKLGWRTKYARVSFGNERYSHVLEQSERQGKLLVRVFMGLLSSPFVVAAGVAWWRWRTAYGGTRWLVSWQSLLGWKAS